MALPDSTPTSDTSTDTSTTSGTGTTPATGNGTGAGSTPAPSSAPAGGLSPGVMAVLRLIATDSDFRTEFAADPIAAVTSHCIAVTSVDMARLAKLTPDKLEELASGISMLSGGGGAGLAKNDGTNTLVYAIIVALLLAETEAKM